MNASKRDDMKELHPLTDAIFDTLGKYDAPPLEGLAALAYCLGFAAGLQSQRIGEDLDLNKLLDIAKSAFNLGKNMPPR